MSGTSFAAPHVSGLAAMYLERNPWATPQEVEAAIVSNATSNVILGANPNLFIFVF
jgi:subtilisin family serine protease